MRRHSRCCLSWNYFIEIDPDLALLQEVNEIPRSIKDQYDYRYLKARKQSGEDQRFGNAVLVKGEIFEDIVSVVSANSSQALLSCRCVMLEN